MNLIQLIIALCLVVLAVMAVKDRNKQEPEEQEIVTHIPAQIPTEVFEPVRDLKTMVEEVIEKKEMDTRYDEEIEEAIEVAKEQVLTKEQQERQDLKDRIDAALAVDLNEL